jgi:CheY-like chemotaxis protein
MAALIDAVYFYTRLDGAAQQIGKQTCDLGAVLEDAKADIGELIRESNAVIAGGPLPTIHGNQRQLSQLFQNLLCNAIHHCRAAPAIRIDALEDESHWSVRIADNGPGVEESQRARIFEPFKRLAHSKAQGLGLGLAICKRIVEAHGGQIRCESSPMGGAAFVFTLPKEIPAHDGPTQVSPADLSDAVSPGGKTLANILLIDDSDADIELTRILLLEKSKLRCNFLVARDACAAKRMLESEIGDAPPIDLILLDINMPGMDGFELLEYMRGGVALRDMPVVVCSTSSYDRDMERAKDLGALGYLVKPAAFETLRPLLDRASGLRLVREGGGHALHRAAHK